VFVNVSGTAGPSPELSQLRNTLKFEKLQTNILGPYKTYVKSVQKLITILEIMKNFVFH
jgi:hypothetical protein